MSTSTHYVIYDGDCPLCTFQMKLLTWMDWLNQTTLVPLANEKVQTLVPNLSREALLSAIHCLEAEAEKLFAGNNGLETMGHTITDCRSVQRSPIESSLYKPCTPLERSLQGTAAAPSSK